MLEKTMPPPADTTRVPATWDEFLDHYASDLFRIVRLFADSYDDRMDLFLFVCERLQADGMRRLRSFRYRPEAPCRFSTFLSVVVKNIALDHLRARQGRFRPFQNLADRGETDRLLFGYHIRDGVPLEECRRLLETRHGIRLTAADLSRRAADLE